MKHICNTFRPKASHYVLMALFVFITINVLILFISAKGH